MKQYKKKIQDYKKLIQKKSIREVSIQNTVKYCCNFMPEPENSRLSYFEFLYGQSKFIKKRWWGLQGCILILLWILLKDSDSTVNVERITGGFAAIFAILIIPEIWKNWRFSAIEIEKASFYSLRQICAARVMLFAMADLVMITIFFVITFHTVHIPASRIIINFLIPFNVSACICFQLLYSKWQGTEYSAVLAGMVWSAAWSFIITQDLVYQFIAQPVWIFMLMLSSGYLFFCVRKSQLRCERIWEDCADGVKV